MEKNDVVHFAGRPGLQLGLRNWTNAQRIWSNVQIDQMHHTVADGGSSTRGHGRTNSTERPSSCRTNNFTNFNSQEQGFL